MSDQSLPKLLLLLLQCQYISEQSKSNNDGISSNDRPTIGIKNEHASDCDTSGPILTAKKLDVSSLQLILHQLRVQPGERINVTPELLKSIPTTSYSRSTMCWIQDNTQHNKTTEEYSTDSTIVYWDSASPKLCKRRKRLSKRKKLPSAKSSIPRSSVSLNFKVSIHGIRHRRCRYSYKCKISGFGKRFSNTHDWNSHH